jgi:CDP-diacylglycerol--glycerol-3-phosphate 3-phosphatidyltransferase
MAYQCAKPLHGDQVIAKRRHGRQVSSAAVVPLLAWRGVATASSVWIWRRWWLLLAVTGLLDNLDGAVAVIGGRTSRAGYVLDSVADRFSDALLLGSLWVLSAPGLLVALTIFVGFVQEYARARAGAARIGEVGVVSISERPTRIVIVSVFLGLCAWSFCLNLGDARRVHGAGRCVDWGSSGRGSAGRSAARVATHRFSGKTAA